MAAIPCPIYQDLAARFPEEHASRRLQRDLRKLVALILGRRFAVAEYGERSWRHAVTRATRGLLRFFPALGRMRGLGRMGYPPCTLSDFYAGGRRLAHGVRPFLGESGRVLEFGGGIGRLATHLADGTREVVSYDVYPLARTYGPRLCPAVTFVGPGDLPAEPAFDCAYSVAVFFHLDDQSQEDALAYVHKRLKPGGRFLVDLRLGADHEDESYGTGWVRTTPREAFLDRCRALYDVKEVRLFNDAFLLTKS